MFLSITMSVSPSLLQRGEATPDLGAHQRRQALGRLVEDQQARIGHERAADREHLLLAARQLRAEIALALAQPREQRVHAIERPRLARPSTRRLVATRFSRTVSVGKICRISGTRPMPACAIRYDGQSPIAWPSNSHAARVRRQHAEQAAHGGRLAHAVAADAA